MAIRIQAGYTWNDGDTVTASRLNKALSLAYVSSAVTARIAGRKSPGGGELEELTAADVKTMLAMGVADLAAIAASSLVGNKTGASAAPAVLTVADVKTLLAYAAGDLANIGAGTLLGNNGGAGAPPAALTAAQARALMGFLGASLAGDVSSTSTSFANVAGLSLTLVAGVTYGFQAVLFVDCPSAAGFKLDLAGGSVTASAYRADAVSIDNAIVRSQNQGNSLAGMLYNTAGSATAPIKVVVDGTITVNAGGTLIPRFAQATASGTSLLLTGSRINAWPIG